MKQETGIFINGKAQVIEMLSLLTSEEKEKLIHQIKKRNPQLAEELLEQSVNFKMLLDLSDSDIEQVISYIDAPVLGVALKALPIHAQKRILSACHRSYAEKAYQAMNTRISNEQRNITRACDRVKDVIAKLMKKNRIKN